MDASGLKMNDNMKTAVKQVFQEISQLTPEEFQQELNEHKNTPRAKAIEYALNPELLEAESLISNHTSDECLHLEIIDE